MSWFQHHITLPAFSRGFHLITRHVLEAVPEIRGMQVGLLHVFIQHTSASLTINENADPDVQRDLVTALRRLAPQDVGWVHDTEGLDDMPAHVRTMLSGVSLHIPVAASRMLLGTWQGLYFVEHRAAPHRRTVIFQFLGTRK